MQSFFNNRIIITNSDITLEETDIIVNAANASLLGGGGVDGAIHRKGGKAILNACKKIREKIYPNGLKTGMAIETVAGNLKAKYVIHTVGPIFGQNPKVQDTQLVSCYLESLKKCRELNCNSIAFPSISTGVYAFPKKRAALLISDFLQQYINEHSNPALIKLVFFTKKDEEIFLETAKWAAD